MVVPQDTRAAEVAVVGPLGTSARHNNNCILWMLCNLLYMHTYHSSIQPIPIMTYYTYHMYARLSRACRERPSARSGWTGSEQKLVVCMCVYVYMYICMYVYIYIYISCIHLHVYVCMYIYIYIHTSLSLSLYIYIYIYSSASPTAHWVFIQGRCSRRGVQWMRVVVYSRQLPII